MVMKRTCALLLICVAAYAGLSGGCANQRGGGGTTTRGAPYTGPTLSMPELAQQINARNERLPTLWAKHYYEATIVDEKKQSHFVNGDGALLFKRPLGMRLVGNKPVAGRVFEIGSTDENYWLTVNTPDLSQMWWGKYEHLGKPCVRPVPIRPDQVFEVLGVSTFNTDLTALPAPTLRFNNDFDAYMVVWISRMPDRYAAVKEVWYDRQTLLPTLVLLFDASGRVQLRAKLANHQPVEVPDTPPGQWPKVATSYKLYFPETGTKMSFELSDMVLCNNGVPCRRGIMFPGATREDAGVDKVTQLDEDCDKPPTPGAPAASGR